MSNEITAYFKGTSGVSESVYQYDYGMILIIDGPDLTAPFEVHFEHTGGVDAVTAIGQDNRVAIPNACLALPGRVTAYIYDHTGQHDGQTAYVVRFQVMNRARPVDEVTDEQDSAISKAIALLAEPINNIETIVNESLAFTGPAISTLEARMDTFASLPAGSTAGNAELVDIRVADGGTTYPTAGDAVREQFSNVKNDLDEFEDGFHNLNLFRYAELLYEDGYASIENGKISAKQSLSGLNAYILPVDGESIYTFTYCRFAFLVGADKETAIGSLLQNVTQVDSTGASYICFSFNYNTYPLATYQISKGHTLVEGFDLPRWFLNTIDPISADLNEILYNLGVNLFDKAELIKENGYASIENGHIVFSNHTLFNAYLIPVDGKSIYTFTACRFAFLLDEDKYTAIGDLLQDVTQIDSTGASYICFSFNKVTYPIDDYKIFGKRSSDTIKLNFATVTGDIVSGGNLQLTAPRNNLRKGERIVFEGDITSFSSLRIGLTYGTSLEAGQQKNYFDIDGTNISYHATNASTAVAVAHGLTLSDNIQIIWEMSSVATCKITLISDGNLFSHEFQNFVRQAIGNPFVLSVGTVLTSCKLTWTCTDLCKDIWMFGDSYFAYSDARWTYYLHQYGYDQNCLLDGFPGEGSVNGRAAFNNLLQYGTPKFAVWCLGMNDGGDSASAPSSDWVRDRDNFLQTCENNNVTPIFGTIPTVPSINHEKKNEWIRSSGYRYIDFAKAVGANSSGVWYSGMLSPDNVHPTEQGARALFARVLLDLPEIMVDDFGY